MMFYVLGEKLSLREEATFFGLWLSTRLDATLAGYPVGSTLIDQQLATTLVATGIHICFANGSLPV